MPTSLRWRFSSGESSGSFGVGSFSDFLSSASFTFLGFDFAFLASEAAFADLGVAEPLALGVELLVNLILGFLTESER